MFTFDIEKWVPKFILNDRNGYALAKAIETGLQMMNNSIEDGVKLINDYDSMPEWRLDELAWETNCLYDYNAPVETKRQWIKNVLPLYELYGTPKAIYQYIGSYFDKIDLQENWEYGGEPYHFRVTVEGEWTPENEAWARKAINTAKNVRSVLDSLRIGNTCLIGLSVESGVLAYITSYPMAGEDFTGQWPQEAYIAEFDNTGKVALQSNADTYKYDYDATGTLPDPNTLGVFDQSGIGISANSTPQAFDYAAPGEKDTGTMPQTNTKMVLDRSGNVGISAEATEKVFDYPGADDKLNTGTIPDQNILAEFDTSIPTVKADDSYIEIVYQLCGEDEIN